MHRGFTKLFNTIVTSTIWSEDNDTRILWITMLALADRFGEVSGSVPGLAHVAHISEEACTSGISKLEAPDPHSRTKDDEGRRIRKIDGGWLILNYKKYRRSLSEEDRREYRARWMRDKRRQEREQSEQGQEREQSGQMSTGVNSNVDVSVNENEHSTEAEAKEKEKEKESVGLSSFSSSFSSEPPYARTKPKQPAPYYPPLPPKRQPTDEQLATAQRIAREETERLRLQLYPPPAAQPEDHPPPAA